MGISDERPDNQGDINCYGWHLQASHSGRAGSPAEEQASQVQTLAGGRRRVGKQLAACAD